MINDNLTRTTDMDGLKEAAQWFVSMMRDRTVFAFRGKMGAGKTTFIKAVCEILGVRDVINSPTFAIVNEYASATDGRAIYHFDFYRLDGENGQQEAEDIGIEDYFYKDALCFIEWPDAVGNLLPETSVYVDIAENADGSRTVSIDS